jgi:hypothetical protein
MVGEGTDSCGGWKMTAVPIPAIEREFSLPSSQ